MKKAYGAGDTVSATVEVRRPTGEALGGSAITAVITIDGVELPRVKAVTHADGGALVKFELPNTMATGDGLLTILVADGGVTESISRPIPIVQKALSLAFFPEGGEMVAGLPTRLYFEARTPLGKPADIEGRVVDDLGRAVAPLRSVKNGLGRVAFTPAAGRRYRAEITRPANLVGDHALPPAARAGCVLRAYDDFDGQAKALRVGVRCTDRQRVTVAATVRDNVLDVASVDAGRDAPGVVYLASADAAIQRAAGVARITVFDRNLRPLAERLVFRNRRARLAIGTEFDKKGYAPRDQVALSITTRDLSGRAVPAELALSVVDDTVVSFADDKSGHLLSKLLLEPELPGTIEEPNFYLDLTELDSARALDLLVGARGYRRFDWFAVLQPEPPSLAVAQARGNPFALNAIEGDPRRMRALPAAAPPMPAPPDAHRRDMSVLEPGGRDRGAIADALQGAAAEMIARPVVGQAGRLERHADQDFARAAAKVAQAVPEAGAWAPVRIFPLPAFDPDFAGPREDYRDTVFWAPSVRTDERGRATLKVVLSDAVTSFRVVAEGVGGGLAGHDETVFKSSLPFSLAVKLPLEVSAGDQPLIPVLLSNESARPLNVRLDATFGSLMTPAAGAGALGAGDAFAAGQRRSLYLPLDVTGTRGVSDVRLSASAGGRGDEVRRSIPVVPVGFPQWFERSGRITGSALHEIDLGQARAGSVQARVTVYTSTLSTKLSGLDGMLREPTGCFEQTSSTNYPNVMIMRYLKRHDVADATLVERSGRLLDSGYKKLTGYESPKKGFEWFGGDPGHEALTAYGLLQFADMKEVYGAVDAAMLVRTAAWLKSRRDGNGGYLRDAKALDSFGRASPEVTDAYITWALATAGETGQEREVVKSARLAETTHDAYLLALATGTLLQRVAGRAPSKAGLAAAARLSAMQSGSGAWTNADHSITRSGGANLEIETTALAIVALLEADGPLEPARKGVAWLQDHRGGFGQCGATQATVLALKALSRFDEVTRVAPQAGAVTLAIDGVVVAEQTFEAGRREPIVFTGFDDRLAPGRHTVTLGSGSAAPLPYSMAIEYRSTEPASSPASVVELAKALAKTDVKMGETVRLQAVIHNKSPRGQPMTLARLGLPGGLTFQNWQLKDLREKGQIAFFETRAREVILYFRDLKLNEVKKIAIDQVASVPGRYTGPASSAHLYYNDTDKSWAAPLPIRITP